MSQQPGPGSGPGHAGSALSGARAPILIAQGGGGAPPPGSPGAPGGSNPPGAHTMIREEHHPGEMPNPSLTFENSVMIAVILVVLAIVARRKLELLPRGSQNFFEFAVEKLNDFTVGIIGPGGERYTPLVGTVFIFILFMNLLSAVPAFHSPTTNITVTFALGVVVFVFVQIEGIRRNGLIGYLKHFMGPVPLLAPLMIPIEMVSEFVKPFTLAVRLFGNIFGEDVIILVLAALGLTLGGQAAGWIPIQLPVVLLSILTDVVQALVFASLTAIYLSLMTHHEAEGPNGEEGAISPAPHGAASLTGASH